MTIPANPFRWIVTRLIDGESVSSRCGPRWWRGAGSGDVCAPPLDNLGSVSPLWLRQFRQQARVEFHGVAWTWPVTTKPRMGEAPGCGDRAPSAAAACLHTGTV